MPTPTNPEVLSTPWGIRTRIDPRLAGMAAAYDSVLSIDTDAIHKALPYLRLPDTPPSTLEVKAELHHDPIFKDVYHTERASFDDGETKGVRATVFFSQRDIKRGRTHQEVALPAIREAINLNNSNLRKQVGRFENRRGNAMFLKAVGGMVTPTTAVVFGLLELRDALGPDAAEAIADVGGAATFAVSGIALLRYGIPLSQKANLRRAPYQKQACTLSEDLPPIFSFSSIKRTATGI